MTSVEEMLNEWKKGLSIETENDEETSHNENGFDMLYMSLTPRIKWFKPPLWKIFMWAYKIDKSVLLKNCFPISSSSSGMETNKTEFTLEFACNNDFIHSPKIKNAANNLLENINKGGISDVKISE